MVGDEFSTSDHRYIIADTTFPMATAPADVRPCFHLGDYKSINYALATINWEYELAQAVDVEEKYKLFFIYPYCACIKRFCEGAGTAGALATPPALITG